KAALDAAEQSHLPAVACEALEVLGRSARRFDLDEAEAAFDRAFQIADEHDLSIQRISALHELGTIDMFREVKPGRLLKAWDLAERCGALARAAGIEIELAAVHNMRAEVDESLRWSLRAAQDAGRLGLTTSRALALGFVAGSHALRADRTAMEAAIAEAERLSGGHPAIISSFWGDQRAVASLGEEKREQARVELERAQAETRKLSVSGPSPSGGLWALLKTLQDDGGEAACEEVRASFAMIQPINQVQLRYADAIRLGRSGEREQAEAAVAEARRSPAAISWWAHYGLRLTAEAAIEDGWGEPAVWLRECAAWFDDFGQPAVASACRSLLRRCGVAMARAHRGVPEPFRGKGVTEREMEVLAVMREGLTNKEIGQRLYLSPKTVEKHVASLMDKLDVRTRAQLAAISAGNLPAPQRVPMK